MILFLTTTICKKFVSIRRIKLNIFKGKGINNSSEIQPPKKMLESKNMQKKTNFQLHYHDAISLPTSLLCTKLKM